MASSEWDPNTVLDAVLHGDIQTVRYYLDCGCPIDLELNQNGDTILLVACRLGLLEIASLALLYNAKNDPHPHYGQTALQHAVSAGHKQIVQLILDLAAPSGLDEVIVNHTDANHGEAPIHVASRCGSDQILNLLILHGANVGVVEGRGRTCLHLACQQGQVSCLLTVLELGGDEFMEVRDDEGYKCLDLAIRSNKMECVQILLQTGAHVSVDTMELASKKPKVMKLLLEYTADTDSIDTGDDESRSSSMSGTIFSGLDTFIASPELRQFQTPMSTEDKMDREEEEEMDMGGDHQFSQNGESWAIYYTDDGFRYFYNYDRDYSSWEDPRRVLFEQHQIQSSNSSSSKKLPPASPSIQLHHLPAPGQGSTNKPTTDSKSQRENEPPNRKLEVINHLEAAESDPKSILLSQIKFQRHKTASSGEQPVDDLHPNTTSPKNERLTKCTTIDESQSKKDASSEEPACDPKSMLLAQIRSRQNKIAPSSEPSPNYMQPNSTGPNTENSALDPKSILLAQIRARQGKPAHKNLHDSKHLCESKLDMEAIPADTLFKYRKMKSVGVPLPAILQRMSRDGISHSAIKSFRQETTDGEESAPPRHAEMSSGKTMNEVAVASPAKSSSQQKEELLKDKSMLKYTQMTKVGVPAAAVAMKMVQDGVNNEIITSFRAAYELDPPGKITPKQLPAPPHRRSSKAMQKVHWSTIEEEKLRNSLWTLSSQVDAELGQKEVEELESLFSASPRPSAKTAIGSKRGKGASATKQISATFIESKRANNVSIGLAQYRSFHNFDDLVTAVASLDDSNLNVEQVNNMTSLLPTTSELSKLKQLNGQMDGLGRAELFFLAVAKMKLFKEKLFAFRYLLQFDDALSSISKDLHTLEKTCTDVISSKNLAFVSKKLLNIGNLMNNQRATGITLSSLIKIAKKKGRDGKVSVIDHLISAADNCDKSSFKHDMPTLRDCARLDLDEIKLSFSEMKSGLKSINNTFEAEQSLTYSPDERPKHTVDFLSRINPFQQRAADELKTMNDLIARVTSKVEELKSFFAEEPSTTSASIFESLLELSSIVETSKEAYHKQRALRRRDSTMRPRTAKI